jgi:hypothetical protein
MSELKTFMSLTDSAVAEEIIEILNTNRIDYKLQDTSKDFDASFANNTAKETFLIMLNANDFDKASKLLDENMKFNIDEIDIQHPLFLFSNNELKDVVKNYDEWHPLDVKLAKYLLRKDNIVVEDSEIKEQQHQKDIKAQQPEKSDFLTLTMGYLFCLLGGLAGIGIAVFLITGKRTMSNGTREYIYTKSDRAHGIYMLVLGAIFFTIFIIKFIS